MTHYCSPIRVGLNRDWIEYHNIDVFDNIKSRMYQARVDMKLLISTKMLKTVLITMLSAFLGFLCSPFASVIIVTFWIHSWITSWRFKKRGLEKMRGVDALFSHYPDMIVNTNFLLSGMPEFEKVCSKLKSAMQSRDENGKLRFRKLSQVMEKHFGLWFWSQVREINLDDHIHLYSGIAPSNEEELNIVTAKVHSIPMRCDIPQWQMTLLPLQGLFLTSGLRSCVIFRFHHSIADAFTFMKFVSSQLVDNPMDYKPKNALGNVKERSSLLYRFFMFGYAMSSIFRVWFTGMITERNLLHGPKLNNKDYVTWAAFDLNQMKALKNAADTTLTDLLLSCLSGAVGQYIIAKNGTVPRYISCIVPMGRYKPDTDYNLENAIIIPRLCIPMNLNDPVTRLQQTKCAFDALKSSPDVLVQKLAVKFLMPFFTKKLLDFFVMNTDAVTIGTSSLAGPSYVKMFDSDVIVPLIYQPHHGLMGINIFFHGHMDKLFVALNADTAIIKCQEDMDMIISYFSQELQELHKKVLSGPTSTIQIPLSQIKKKCPPATIYDRKLQLNSAKLGHPSTDKNGNIYNIPV